MPSHSSLELVLHSVGVILSREIPRRGALHGHLGTGQGLRTILLNLLAWSLECSECLWQQIPFQLNDLLSPGILSARNPARE